MRSDITPGQTSDYLGFDLVMDDNLPEPSVLLADRGYDWQSHDGSNGNAPGLIAGLPVCVGKRMDRLTSFPRLRSVRYAHSTSLGMTRVFSNCTTAQQRGTFETRFCAWVRS